MARKFRKMKKFFIEKYEAWRITKAHVQRLRE